MKKIGEFLAIMFAVAVLSAAGAGVSWVITRAGAAVGPLALSNAQADVEVKKRFGPRASIGHGKWNPQTNSFASAVILDTSECNRGAGILLGTGVSWEQAIVAADAMANTFSTINGISNTFSLAQSRINRTRLMLDGQPVGADNVVSPPTAAGWSVEVTIDGQLAKGLHFVCVIQTREPDGFQFTSEPTLLRVR